MRKLARTAVHPIRSLLFGGNVSDRVDHGNDVSLQNLSTWSTVGWWYPTTLTGFRHYWSKRDAFVGGRFSYIPNTDTSRVRAEVIRTVNDSYESATGSITVNKWHFIAITYDLNAAANERFQMYFGDLNTVPVETIYNSRTDGNGALGDDSGDSWVTCQRHNDTGAFQGRCAMVSHWNIVLPYREIADQWENPWGIVRQGNNVLFTHYGGETSLQKDLSGRRNHGTVAGAVTSVPFPIPSPIWNIPFAPPAAADTVIAGYQGMGTRAGPNAIHPPPYFPTGEGMRARLFDDVAEQYLSYGTAIQSTYPFTFSCWFNRDVEGGLTQDLISIADDADVNYWRLVTTDAPNELNFQSRSAATGSEGAEATTFWSLNTWHHACGVGASATERTVYLDGGGADTNNVNNTPINLDNTLIGALETVIIVGHFSGRIAFAALWNIDLSKAEVWRLAHGAYPWEIRPGNLTGLWLVGPNNDRDYSGRGHHMTAVNTPTWGPGPPKVPPPFWRFPFATTAAAPPVTERVPRHPAIIFQIPAIV